MTSLLDTNWRPSVVRFVHDTASIFGPYVSMLLENLGAVPMDINIGDDIHSVDLANEVLQGLLPIQQNPEKTRTSIAAELLQNAAPTSLIGQICTKAHQIMFQANGLTLPGGENVEPVFYDSTKIAGQHVDYRRSIAEFALIFAAHRLKKPILGTCRGIQIINVAFGGTVRFLNQKEDGWQVVEFTDSTKRHLLQTAMQANKFVSWACHYQTCDRIAPNFEVVAHYRNIPKMIMSSDGLIMGIQVHPEKAIKPTIYSPALRIYGLFFENMRPSERVAPGRLKMKVDGE